MTDWNRVGLAGTAVAVVVVVGFAVSAAVGFGAGCVGVTVMLGVVPVEPALVGAGVRGLGMFVALDVGLGDAGSAVAVGWLTVLEVETGEAVPDGSVATDAVVAVTGVVDVTSSAHAANTAANTTAANVTIGCRNNITRKSTANRDRIVRLAGWRACRPWSQSSRFHSPGPSRPRSPTGAPLTGHCWCLPSRRAHSAPEVLMVNLMPREPRPQDADYREWLLRRLDFLWSLVESGADVALEDSQFTAHDGRRVAGTTLSFYEDVWVAHHRSRRRAG